MINNRLSAMPSSHEAHPSIVATSSAALLFSHGNDLDLSERSHRIVEQQSACQESYRLFKKCSTARETEGFSCSKAVASYMRCAMNGC
mmetsp:Transcript_6956/g.12388  ORF Transcript_6956/g.12388 Transcript_6956/m.12388 type:complete len:88 (-) Transcript_6956:306-569(-)